MAFMDKLGQVANKVVEVGGDTFDYGKAKGKIVLEKGKIKDAKESIGNYVYNAVNADGEIDMERISAFCAEIDEHLANIAKLEGDAKQSGSEISNALGKEEE